MFLLSTIEFAALDGSDARTVRAGDLAPDHPDVGTPNLTLGPVDESDLLAQVEAAETVLVTSSMSSMLFQTLLTLRPRCCRHRRSGSDCTQCQNPCPICSSLSDANPYLVLGLTACLERW